MKENVLCVLCCALHVTVQLCISVNTHAEDKELISFSMALYLLSLKQSLMNWKFGVSARLTGQQAPRICLSLPTPPTMLGLYICAAVTCLELFKMWVLGI